MAIMDTRALEQQRELHAAAQRLAALAATCRPDLLELTLGLVRRSALNRPGPGFTSVLWNGEEHFFSPMQASIVKQLWEAWEAGTPWVRQELLLLYARGDEDGDEKECLRVRDLFRRHPTWHRMITSKNGAFRLFEPGQPEAEAVETVARKK